MIFKRIFLMRFLFNFDKIKAMKIKLSALIKEMNHLGHSPATSTNYSFREENGDLWVSRSGIDKSSFAPEDFIRVDQDGAAIDTLSSFKASAETLIHCTLYDLFPDAKVVLHSHSIFPVLLSDISLTSMKFQGYEILKGFIAVTSHESTVEIPVLDNSQDMEYFKHELNYRKEELQYGVFMIKKHGFYAWGNNLLDAKRHLETFQYLCECEWLKNKK